MTPEVWATIRQDWIESLPAVLAGEDDRFYQFGWARENAAPRTVKTSMIYLCSAMRWDRKAILSMGRTARVCKRRDAIGLALWRKHNTSLSNLAKIMHRDWSSLKSLLDRAKGKESRDPDFADLVKELEALL